VDLVRAIEVLSYFTFCKTQRRTAPVANRISWGRNPEPWSDIGEKRPRARTTRSGVQREDVPSRVQAQFYRRPDVRYCGTGSTTG
jgi:hypothetical protein